MVDKLFFCGELFVLRCSFRNLPTLGPILIESLFYVVFYTRDGLVFSLTHGYRSVRSICSGLLGLVFILFSNHLLLRVYEVLLDSLQVHSHYSRISHFERPGKIVIHTKKSWLKYVLENVSF